MNDEDHLQPWLDPELEARIVALVLGEASDFEREELERLLSKDAELSVFRQRIEAVHGLLRSTSTGEILEDDLEWKLPAQQREALLATLAGSPATAATPVVNTGATATGEATRLPWSGLLKIAAVLAVGAIIVAVAFPAGNLLDKVALVRSDTPEIASSETTPLADSLGDLDVFIDAPIPDRSAGSKPQSANQAPRALEDAINLTNNLAVVPAESPAAGARGYLGYDLQTAPADDRYTLGRASAGKEVTAQDGFSGNLAMDSGSDSFGLEMIITGSESRFLKQDRPAPATPRAESMPAIAAAPHPSAAPAPAMPEVAGAIVTSSGIAGKESKDLRQLVESAPADKQALGILSAATASGGSASAPAQPERSLGRKISPTGEDRPAVVAATRRDDQSLGELSQVKESLAEDFEIRLRKKSEAPAYVELKVGEITRDENELDSLTVEALSRTAPAPAVLDEILASEEPFSTFSLHVSDVSFKLAQAALAQGQWPEAGRIRIEEFVNAFDYGDPAPALRDKIACAVEQSVHPFLQQRNLLRVSMRTAAAGRNAATPLRLTILLDNSGSMERADRRETLRRAFTLLAAQLRPADRVTLISFARQPRLLADRLSGDQSAELLDVVANLPSEGGTNLEAALRLAYEKALEGRLDTAQNRIVLLTDGAANLGDAEPGSLARLIETVRDSGIAFDAAGIGADGLNDEILEALTRKGDGRYYFLDRPEDAGEGFARQLAGALSPAAKNVKIQVEFNPGRVARYRLLGFEKHRLDKEDFRNDAVDAAEMAAEEAGVALYQFEPLPGGAGDVGSVSVRFQDMATGTMVEKRWPLPYEPNAPRLDAAAPSLRIAATAAIFAARLGGDPLGDTADLAKLAATLSGLPDRYLKMQRVQQLREMIDQARRIAGE